MRADDTMALMECPDCETQVSDAAAQCPKCSRPIASVQSTAPVAEKKSIGTSIVELVGGLTGWAILIGLGLFAYSMFTDDSPERISEEGLSLSNSQIAYADNFVTTEFRNATDQAGEVVIFMLDSARIKEYGDRSLDPLCIVTYNARPNSMETLKYSCSVPKGPSYVSGMAWSANRPWIAELGLPYDVMKY